jgi:hypothetical protein
MIITLKVGDVVRHPGHGVGIIVALNTRPKAEYLDKRDGLKVVAGLMSMIGLNPTNLLYDGDRYPYMVLFENGYKDCYAPTEITLEQGRPNTVYSSIVEAESGELVRFLFIGSQEYAENCANTVRLMGFETEDPKLMKLEEL